MPVFTFNKLVRDKFRKIYDELGQKITTRLLTKSQLKEEIRRKIIEEAEELPTADTKNDVVVGEIADIQQALVDLKRAYGIDDDEIRQAMDAKYEKKGGFRDGLFVETIELRDDDEWVEYYRQQPYKYPEVGRDMLDSITIPEIEPGQYVHYKNKRYEVIGVALHSETLEPMVVYRPLYETRAPLWLRPYDMFVGEVEVDGKRVKRFQKI